VKEKSEMKVKKRKNGHL